MKLTVFLFAIIFLHISCAKQKFNRLETSTGSCPNNLTYVTSLDPGLMQGVWYSHYLSNTKVGDCDGHCWSSFASRASSTSLAVSICCQKGGRPLCGDDVGSLTLTFNDDEPGVLRAGKWTVFYLDIKFDEYLIGIVCSLSEGNSSKPIVYVSRRTSEFPEGFEDLVTETLRKNGLDPDISKVLHHDQCNYVHSV